MKLIFLQEVSQKEEESEGHRSRSGILKEDYNHCYIRKCLINCFLNTKSMETKLRTLRQFL